MHSENGIASVVEKTSFHLHFFLRIEMDLTQTAVLKLGFMFNSRA